MASSTPTMLDDWSELFRTRLGLDPDPLDADSTEPGLPARSEASVLNYIAHGIECACERCRKVRGRAR